MDLLTHAANPLVIQDGQENVRLQRAGGLLVLARAACISLQSRSAADKIRPC